jgi:acyl transferase domain-containing protein
MPESIAIVGTGCRFTGNANTLCNLGKLLSAPSDLVTLIPPDRFSSHGFFHPDGSYHGHGNVKASYTIAGDTTHRRLDA